MYVRKDSHKEQAGGSLVIKKSTINSCAISAITTNIVSSNPFQATCTWYNIIW